MKHITDYLAAQQKTFSQVPFNPLDSLILSTVGYFNLEFAYSDEVYEAPQLLLQEVIRQSDAKQLTKDIWLSYSTRTNTFLEELTNSKRYEKTRLGLYVNEISEKVEMQFAAVCLILPDNTMYVSFRGTDMSFTGWKEDFNLGYKEEIPSHASAVDYTEKAALATNGKLILGGHSKGGNLAEYAALLVNQKVYRRIIKVFNHDGPSFLKDPSKRITTSTYNKKLHKTIPAASPIGLVMERRKNYHIVKSDGISVLQHEPFSWLIRGNNFVYQKKPNRSTAIFDAALNRLIQESTAEEREQIIESLYQVLTSTNTDSWSEFGDNFIQSAQQLLNSGSELDDDTKQLLGRFSQKFMEAIRDELIKVSLPVNDHELKLQLPKLGASSTSDS